MAAGLTLIPLLILLCHTVAMETKPSPQLDDNQILRSLFGSHLSSLIVAPHTDDITKGSGLQPGPAPHPRGAGSAVLLDFLQQQVKMRRRSRKSMMGVGGRGCFGMKMDRIGSVSGLGC